MKAKNDVKAVALALGEATTAAGGLSALAGLLGVKPPTVYQWRAGKRPVPTRKAVLLEQITGVPRMRFRPADWHEHWPASAGRG